jgi:hypothetical protein
MKNRYNRRQFMIKQHSMRRLFLLFLVMPFTSFGQEIDIYGKWTAFLDKKTQVILDLSNKFYISAMRIQLDEEEKYRVDSFGYKRMCYASFKVLDSSRIFWIAQMGQIHPNIQEGLSVGEFIISKRNLNNTPIALKMIDELPELGISFSEGDTLELTRMITKLNTEEILRFYKTIYGGTIEETIYAGKHGGLSAGIYGVGMRYKKVNINQNIKHNFQQKLTSIVNRIREELKIDSLMRDSKLDNQSSIDLNEWINGMKSSRQIITEENTYASNVDKKYLNFNMPEFEFYMYPFHCGKNMLLMSSLLNFGYSKKGFEQYIDQNYNQLAEYMVAAMMSSKGGKQNIINQGYATLGIDIEFVEGTTDDFYFNENANKIAIRNDKNIYYYLIISQRFSVEDKIVKNLKSR